MGSSGELQGYYKDIIAVKTKERGQDGGFVTALLNYLLDKKLIDGAIVGGVENKTWKPKAMLATDKKEIRSSAGSRYSASPNLAALKEAKERGLERLAVVGLPCQIEGVRKMEEYPLVEVDLAGRIKYTISLFCSKNYLYSMLQDLVVKKYKVKLEDVTKFDIKGKNVFVYTGDKCTEIPIVELEGYVRKGCYVCPDYTGKLADFAVGAVGSPKGWSTVIMRSKEAEEIVKKMLKEYNVESKKVTEEKFGLGIIRKLAMKKEESAKKNIVSKQTIINTS